MKKIFYVILAIVASSIVTATFLWSNGQPTQQSAPVYHKGDQIPNTVFTFDGFTYNYPPIGHPPMGSSPLPKPSPTLMLCAVFKLNAAGEAANQAPGTHIAYPTQDVISLNPNGNTTTDLGSGLDNQFYTIVAYNENAQTISMVYG
jgi:hypothetical protein